MQNEPNHNFEHFFQEAIGADNSILVITESQPNNNNITNVLKQQTILQDQPLNLGIKTRDEFGEMCPEDNEHNQIRKFLRKAEKINEISYKRLNSQMPHVPQGKSLSMYKSNKNVLQDINIPNERDRHIKSIYLRKEMASKCKYNSQKYTNKLSLHRRKQTTDSKFVQTQLSIEENEQIHKKSRTQKFSLFPKAKITMKAIEEDDDQEFIPAKRKNFHKGYNTIQFGNKVNQSKVDVARYLLNINKNQFSFSKSIKRNSFTSEFPQQSTRYSEIESVPKKLTFLQTISNNEKFNPWANVAEEQESQDMPVINKHVINENMQTVDKTKSKSLINQNQYISLTETKKIILKNSNQHTTTQNSLSLENNNSMKQSHVEDNEFSISKKSKGNHFIGDKMSQVKQFQHQIRDKVNKVQTSVQAPDVREIKIGTDTNNFILPPKRSVHPINIGFNESDTTWITSHYKPKSQFMKKIDTQNFHIKKYRNGVYFGQLNQEGLKHGLGVIFYFNGRSYEGYFHNDMKQGKGFEYMPDGSTYSGQFKKGLKEGKGIFQWANGELYDGQWIGGKKNGSGMWKSPNGDSYIGEWKNGKIQGFGVLTVKQGDRYEGQFKNSMKNGLGTERYSNGDTYVGQFLKNRPNGQGQYFHNNGDIYKGFFSNGLKHGDGYLKTQKGQIYQGQFRNDKKCGYGQIIDNSGTIYTGNFENDLRHGYGQQKTQQNEVRKGYWINGQIVNAMESIQQDKLETYESIKVKKQLKNKNNDAKIESLRKRNKAKKRSLSKSPKNSPKHSPKFSKQKSIERQRGGNQNFHRACGCKRHNRH